MREGLREVFREGRARVKRDGGTIWMCRKTGALPNAGCYVSGPEVYVVTRGYSERDDRGFLRLDRRTARLLAKRLIAIPEGATFRWTFPRATSLYSFPEGFGKWVRL